MATLKDIITEKYKRLDDVPNTLYSQTLVAEKEIYSKIIDLVSRLERDANGFIIQSEANARIGQNIKTNIRQVFDESQYLDAVATFAGEYNPQMDLNTSYFRKVFPDFVKPSTWATNIVQVNRNSVIGALVNTSADLEYVEPMAQLVEQAVLNGSSFIETVDNITEFAITSPTRESKLLRYTKQIAHDAFAVTDRTYTNQLATDMGVEWYKYSGSEIKTTRPFCDIRSNKYYPRAEVQSWANQSWTGKFQGTNTSNIFNYAGGYNCRHSLLPVSVRSVPIDRVKEAIRAGYYDPDKTTRELLGLDVAADPPPAPPSAPPAIPTPNVPKKVGKKPSPGKPKKEFISTSVDETTRKSIESIHAMADGADELLEYYETATVYDTTRMLDRSANLRKLQKQTDTNIGGIIGKKYAGHMANNNRYMKIKIDDDDFIDFIDSEDYMRGWTVADAESKFENVEVIKHDRRHWLMGTDPETNTRRTLGSATTKNGPFKKYVMGHPKTPDGRENIATTITHELGHLIQNAAETKRKFWNDGKAGPFADSHTASMIREIAVKNGVNLSDAPTIYGQTNWREFWCESFAMYVYAPKAFQRDFPKAYEMFIEVVKAYDIDITTIKQVK